MSGCNPRPVPYIVGQRTTERIPLLIEASRTKRIISRGRRNGNVEASLSVDNLAKRARYNGHEWLLRQNDPNIEPSTRTATSAMITLTITVITMSK